MAEFDPTQPPPTLNEFQADFQPTAEDINAIHGEPRNLEEKKEDEEVIRGMETDGLSKHWSSPWFECKDLSKFHVSNPKVDFPRIARQYENILEVWQNNYQYGRKIQQNPQLRLPPFARLDQACNGDLEASNARRRKHLIGTIAYCWQLRKICEDEKEWLRQQANKRRVIKPKKKDKKDDKKDKKKSKKGDKKEEEEDKEEDKEEEEEEVKEEPNPYIWGNTNPTKLYNEMAKGLVGVYFLCLCGFVPIAEIQSDLYYQKKYDAAHVFANHMAKLVYLTTADNKPLFQVVLNMICTGNTGRNFVFTHHLHNCINFESKHSSQSLREQAGQLEQTLSDLPATSSKRLQKLGQLQLIEKELNTCSTLNDQYIQIMKVKAIQNRTDRKTKQVRGYPDYVYLRVFHELGLQREAIKFLSSWGITEEDYNRVWRKIDNGTLDNKLRHIICNMVSDKDKKQTAMDIDHHKLGIGPDYIKKKYSDLLSIYNQQRQANQIYDNDVANMLDTNTDFLNHFGNVPDGGNNQQDDGKLNLKEDAINTTMFAHKYLSGQIFIPNDDDETKDIDNEEKKQPLVELKEEEKKDELITDDGIFVPTVEKEEKIEVLPKNNAKLQQLLRRKERLLVSMTTQHGYKEDEIKKLLELTDGRAVALSPMDFFNFYGQQPIELVHKFMDKNLTEEDREKMSVYLKTILDSYRRIQVEKMKLKDPAKHFGSLRSAVNAHHQAAIERIGYAAKKYTDEYFQKVQQECDAYEKKLQEKKHQERTERRQRLEAIKKLERKKRERLTTPINNGDGRNNVLNDSEKDTLKSLNEDQQVLTQNEQIIKENITIKESNEHILDQFFDNEDAKLKQMISPEAKEERIRGPDDSNKNDLGMQSFLERESNKNYGMLVAAKTDVKPIAEQIIGKKIERIRQRTTSRHLVYTQEQLGIPSPGPSPGIAAQDQSSSNLYMQSQNEKLQNLLLAVSNSHLKEITSEMRADAKSLLTPAGAGGFKSKSPSPMMSAVVDDHMDDDFDAPPKGHGHYKSSSVVVHDNILDGIIEESDEHDELNGINGIDDMDDRDRDIHMYGDHDDDDDDDDDDMDDDPFKLPFEDIDIVEHDLTFLETDELVPITQKDLLEPDDIAKLKVKEVPDMDVIRSDGLEQRHRQSAVDKLEKSYMADAALKKAKEKEKELMQKRLEEQAQAKLAAELKEEQKEFDLLKQGGIIRQKKTAEELKAEYAALTDEQKEERRKKRQERNQYTANRNPKLLQKLDRGVEEETVMVEVEMDDFEMIPMEDTEVGKELAESERMVKEMEAKYGGDDVIMSSDDELIGVVGVVDKRQEMIFHMNTKEIYEYIINGTNLSEDIACKILENGLTGEMVEIAVMDDELDEILKDMGFDYTAISKLIKILKYDGWNNKESYPISMSGNKFNQWVDDKLGKKIYELIINNGIDGRCIGIAIDDGGNELNELLMDIGINDEKEIESFRSEFVIDSNMVQHWNVYDLSRWLKKKLKSVKNIDGVIQVFHNNDIDGSRLLGMLYQIPSEELSALGIEQTIQGKIHGKISAICKHILNMSDIEIMYWIHSMPIEKNSIIAQTLYEKKIDGKNIANQGDLKSFLKKQLKKGNVPNTAIDTVVAVMTEIVTKNGGFIPNHVIQDPNIMDYNENTSSKGGKKKIFKSEEERIAYEKKKADKKRKKMNEKQSMIKSAKRRHSRIQSKIELGGQAFIEGKDGIKYMRVYKGKKKVQQAQKIKNYSKKTITLEKANNREQAKIRLARKQKYERRRLEKEAIHKQVSGVITQQLEHGIQEANEMFGIRDDDDDEFYSSDEEYTDSEEELERKLMMTHRSQMSTSRLAERLEFVGDAGDMLDVKEEEKQGLMVPGTKRKGAGRVTMAGHALEDFVGGNERALFHKRRASSIVQRIVAKSKNDLENYRMRRGSKSRISRRSLSKNLSGSFSSGGSGRHSRGFSSGHFVSQFFKNASDRQKLEAGMRGEAPLIVYYCDKDGDTTDGDNINDIYQTSVLDTYIDDYSTFDDYIKILSMRLQQAQKKHRTEMDELRRNKEDLTNEVSQFSTQKEELIRLIGQERSLFKRELPSLATAKLDANKSQDDYEKAERIIRDKFNETKLHVMMMMQFRDNHLRKLDEEKLRASAIRQEIQSIQSDIEELLSKYFTLQNAHNKLEHTIALLSELTTLCHEVNTRKKGEYEREMQDLLAMIERYRCRIRNVDRLILQYEKEVVELRMLHEKRSSEFKKIQKNPTTNRTAATIDYYVAQRKLYEEKIAKQDSTFDDFFSVTQRYTKELSRKNAAKNHYDVRSQLADNKFKRAVQKKNQIYKECRDLCKSLNISWKQAEKEYIERGHELAQQFHEQYDNMLQFEQDNKPYGYEFIDTPYDTTPGTHSEFNQIIINKTHEQILREEEYIKLGQLDRVYNDIDIEKIKDNDNYQITQAHKTFDIDSHSSTTHMQFKQDAIAKSMSKLHRGDENNLDTYRAPGFGNMDEHPDNSLLKTWKNVDISYHNKYQKNPKILVNLDTSYIEQGTDQSDQDDDDDDYHDNNDNDDDQPQQQTHVKSTRSVHFKDGLQD